MIVDYHLHLRDDEECIAHRPHAIGPFVETALARGVDEIGFAEHVYYFRQTAEIWELSYQSERCVYDLDEYCDAVISAKQAGLPVKLGIEVDFVGEQQQRLGEILDEYPFDYRLGSVHWLDGLAVDMSPGAWEAMTVDEIWQQYTKALCELAVGGTVDVIAHPDLPKIFGRRPDAALLADLHEQTALTIAAAGLAIEVSTAGLRKPVGELYPDAALLAACARTRVPITLASDAHSPGIVGADFDQALALARSTGCETLAVFDERRATPTELG